MPTPEEVGKGYYEAEERGELTRTDSGFGWQMNSLDEFSLAFIQAMNDKSVIKDYPLKVADLGAGYGYSSKQLLERTPADVIVNDISATMVEAFANTLSADQQRRVSLKPGSALELDIEPSSLDGIMALRYMHFMTATDIRRMFEKFGLWLKPGGVLCLTAATPYIAVAQPEALPIYRSRKAEHVEWPGEITADIRIWPKGIECKCGYLFDEDVLRREARRVGLEVTRCGFLTRTFALTNGNENIGMLALKATSQ